MIFVIFSIKNASEKWDGLKKAKNRMLEPQKQTADEAPRIAQVRGKELKDGGSLGIGCQSLKRQSQASIWRYEGVDEWEEDIRIYPTRKPALREAADVLRADRRTRR